MSVISIAFRSLSVLLIIELNGLFGLRSDDSDAELSSLSCFNTEIPATCLSVGVRASSSACLCLLSVLVGVHFRLVEVDEVVGVTEFSADVADFDVWTLLKGVAKDANFCARIFTGTFQTAPAQYPQSLCRLYLHQYCPQLLTNRRNHCTTNNS